MGDYMLARVLSVVFVMSLFAVFTTEEVDAQDDNLLNMIEVRSEDGWTSEVNQMVANLNRVDARIHRHANASGVRIILMDVGLTELPEFAHLSGYVPAGWSETGLTWDEVPGAGGIVTAARIGYSQPGNSHSVVNLELHEYAHAVDEFTAGFKISHSDEFQQIHSRENSGLFYDHAVPKYFNMVSEYFAEAFAMYYYSESSRQKLALRAPETHQFIGTLKNRLVSIESTTGNTVTLSFTPLGNATSYNIYRDNELVGQVPAAEGQFTDTGLNVSSTYGYFVRAVDANGSEYMTSYFRNATTGTEADPESEAVEEPVEEVDEPETEEVIETPETEVEVEEQVQEEIVEEQTEEVIDPQEVVEETTEEVPEFEEVTNEVVETETSTEEQVNPSDAVEFEEESLETSTQQAQSSNDTRYPMWVYFISSLIGAIVTFGVLIFLARRMR